MMVLILNSLQAQLLTSCLSCEEEDDIKILLKEEKKSFNPDFAWKTVCLAS